MPVSRISATFERTRREGRAALVAYIMAGDPDIETSFAALTAIRDGGADVIELGFPFTDPMADGPAIQKAALRALAGGATLTHVLELVRRFRETDSETPLILMGYANPVHLMGYGAFAAALAEAGGDGSIIVDLPPEEDAPLREAYAAHDLAVIRLATPTTTEARMKTVAEGASGFLYYVSVAGVTGAGSARPEDIASGVDMARRVSGLPVAVGFGVRSGAQAADMAEIADGVVVGSAFVAHAETKTGADCANAMGELAAELRRALDNTATADAAR
jgi:tryptophan synthase alpha chain